MNTRTGVGILVVAAVLPGIVMTAYAQPRPPAVRREEKREEKRDEKREEKREEKRDEHAAEQWREHFQKQQEQERLHRKEERRDLKAWIASRNQRAEQRRKDIATSWGTSVNTPEARAELTLHADRMARLNRLLDIYEDKGDTAAQARVKVLLDREIARDSNAMASIRARAGAP